MRKKDLIARMDSGCKRCLVCDAALDEIRKRGFSELPFILCRIAEDLWTDSSVSEEKKKTINDRIAALMDLLFSEAAHDNSKVNNSILQIDRAISPEFKLYSSWADLKDVIREAKAT